VGAGADAFTVLAIVPRSNGYGGEWASNFTVGSEGDSFGFSESADHVMTFVEDYMARHPVNNTLKVWVVGYSRGAAVANLVVGRITVAGSVGEKPVEKENVFGYTFNTPAGLSTEVCSVEEAGKCTNIHNVILANDLVPKVAPREWGFFLYGTDESLIPETRTEENAKLYETMVEYLPAYCSAVDEQGNPVALYETYQGKAFTKDVSALSKLGSWKKQNGIYVWKPVDAEKAKEILIVDSDKPLSETLDDMIEALTVGIGGRKDYADDVEAALRFIQYETTGNGQQIDALSKAIALLKEQLKENELSILAAACTGKIGYLEKLLCKMVQDIVGETGLDTGSYATVVQQAIQAIPKIAGTIVSDALIDGCSDIISLIENFDMLSGPHYAHQCMAWMMTLDPNYHPELTSQSGRVTDVKVDVLPQTVTKRFLFWKRNYTVYQFGINPVSDNQTYKKIEYSTVKGAFLKEGTGLTSEIKLKYLYIRVTDFNGNVTNWEYRSGRVSRILS